MRLAVSVFLLIFLAGSLAPAVAQDSDTTEYAREALRIKTGLWGNSLVQGRDEAKLMGLGMFAGNVDFLDERTDPIGVSFDSFRSKKNASGTFYLIALGLFTAAVIEADPYESNQSAAFLVGSLGAMLTGSMLGVSAHESLSQSVWMYNSTLDTRGP